MARYLLVDGHSVIFAWPELRKLHTRRTALGREELVKRMTEYQDASGVRVVVVFDGKGGTLSDDTAPGGIQVFYSAGKQTADSIIERLVVKYSAEHDLTVVTADHLEQQTVSSFGAQAISPEMLRQMCEEMQDAVAKQLKRLRAG